MIFPYANANLRDYWSTHTSPSFDRETVLWVLKQMTGIANGTVLIHDFKVTHPLRAGENNLRTPGTVRLSVKPKEQYFGRHGDIKPENILWFAKDSIHDHAMGVLQIADFGLGRFHGRESRSGVSKDVAASPTYEPPECKLDRSVSRKYDIWSLGCFYLEFITWILRGTEQIEEFANSRGCIPTGGFVNDDYFYTITNVDGVKDAVVRNAVRAWVTELHAHEKCSLLMHDLLNLVMNELLVIDPETRSPAVWLHVKLKEFLDQAERDDEYLLTPKPIPLPTPEVDTSMSANPANE